MRTWLVIFRGDPMDGGMPIGIVNDQEVCLTAVRAAWAEFRRHLPGLDAAGDPVRRHGLDGIERRLRAAAEELGGDAAATTLEVVATARDGDARAELDARVLRVLQERPEGLSTRQVRLAVRGRDCEIDAALGRLEAAGRAKSASGPRGAFIWRAEGSWPGAAEKARPEPRADAGHGPAELDVEPDREGRS